jgi:copper(I)-binding protein
MKLSAPLVLSLLVLAGAAQAQSYRLGQLRISAAHARPTVAMQPTGGAYLTIENEGDGADILLAASTPAAASTQIHSMKMDGNVMRMREVGKLELPPHSQLAMTPGAGYHLMLVGLKQPLKAGAQFPLTLVFEKAGKLQLTVSVDADAMGTHQHK